MTYRRTDHAVYELNYHIVWPPKYRKHIGTVGVKTFLEALFPRIAREYGFEILDQSVQPDHIHLFISAPPRFAPARIVNVLKSISARETFRKYPAIRRELWGGELWGNGYFVRAVGEKVTTHIIKNYIRYQQRQVSEKQQKLF